MLVSLTELLQDALARGYALGSFNVSTLEMMDTLMRTASETQSPVIVSTAAAEARHLGVDLAAAAAKTFSERYGTVAALHLDHGDSFEVAIHAIRAGYTSVMYDGSHRSISANIETTKRVAQVAHAVGVSVEGEVGRIAGKEDDINVDEADAHLTDIHDATRFVDQTGVDALAVAVGNAHGFYLEEPQIDFGRLQAIREATGVPIVLHGGTGIPQEQIRQAIQLGLAKINIASRLRRAYLMALRSTIEEDSTDVISPMRAGRDALRLELIAALTELGSLGMAN